MSTSRSKWLEALKIIRQAMDESGLKYVEGKGEAAFYGPKIDFMIKSAIGTEYTISTNQLDFLATQTFDLKYIGEDGADHPVYVIHRAPLGTHERFTAFLIEHYAGAFPTWLAPIQARVIPISDKAADYAQKVLDALFNTPVVNGTAGCASTSTPPMSGCRRRSATPSFRKSPICWWLANAKPPKARSRCACARARISGRCRWKASFPGSKKRRSRGWM